MDEQLALDGFYLSGSLRTMIDQQGRRANYSGGSAERIIYHTLRDKGYSIRRHHQLSAKSLHGGKITVDFMVTGIRQYPNGLIIESKWQDDLGSADEKMVFLVVNIKRNYTAPTIIVYGGGGARSGIIEYARGEVDGQKLIAVFSFEEFISWAIRNL